MYTISIINNLNQAKMPKISEHHQSIQVRCSMDEPIQLLVDKLSSKSPELYIFWQNYDQMYRHYNEKVIENTRLKQQLELARRSILHYQQQPQKTQPRPHQDPYLKDRLKTSQHTCQQLRIELQKSKNLNRDMKSEQHRLLQQINQMQLLISQLRQENSQQRISIANILQKLKTTQQQINGFQKVYEQIQEKQIIVGRLLEREKEMEEMLGEKEEEIERLGKEFRDTRSKYERIIKESMQNAKQSVMNSLPHNYKGVEKRVDF